jgi:putative phosphoesterase
MAKRAFHIGVISDTHGLLREQALRALEGSDLIVHAGDMGSPEIVPRLRRIAPVVAVRGNVDREPWAASYAEREVVAHEPVEIYVLHNLRELDLAPAKAGFAAVISGHTHDPKFYLQDGVLYFNPGSAGPQRFRLPVSLGKITIVGEELLTELITLSAD